MYKQSILDLLLSSQYENIDLAEQILIGLKMPIKTLLDEFGYSQIGIKSFEDFNQSILVINGLSTEIIPKLPASIIHLYLCGIVVEKVNLGNQPNLNILYCGNNQLRELNLKDCAILERLYCDVNLRVFNAPNNYNIYFF